MSYEILALIFWEKIIKVSQRGKEIFLYVTFYHMVNLSYCYSMYASQIWLAKPYFSWCFSWDYWLFCFHMLNVLISWCFEFGLEYLIPNTATTTTSANANQRWFEHDRFSWLEEDWNWINTLVFSYPPFIYSPQHTITNQNSSNITYCA